MPMINDATLIERAAIAARTAFENVAPESGAAEWARFTAALAAPPSEWTDHHADCAEEISCWTRVARAVLAVQGGEIERLRQALGAMTADMMGMRDGALVRDQAAEIERLRADMEKMLGAEAAVVRLTTERDDALAGCNHWRNDYTELQGALTTKNTEIARLTAERDAAIFCVDALRKIAAIGIIPERKP